MNLMQLKKPVLDLKKLTQSQQSLLLFWFSLVFGVVFYLLILLGISQLPVSVLLRNSEQIPVLWQALYTVGLYLLLWSLSTYFVKRQGSEILYGSLLDLGKGLLLSLLGAGSLFAVLAGFKLALVVPVDFSWLILPEIILMALAIASIEEYVFRGFHFEAFKLKHSILKSCLLQALVYASVHLLRSDLLWYQWILIFFNLTLIGFILAQVRIKKESLAWPIGLHAGWIIATNFAARVQVFHWNSAWDLWTGHGNPAYGLSGSLCLMLVLLMMHSANSDHPGRIV